MYRQTIKTTNMTRKIYAKVYDIDGHELYVTDVTNDSDFDSFIKSLRHTEYGYYELDAQLV